MFITSRDSATETMFIKEPDSPTCRLSYLKLKKNQFTIFSFRHLIFSMRKTRNMIIQESDWMANSDVTMSADWKTYRQALRDITKQTPADDILSNITWPKKPE